MSAARIAATFHQPVWQVLDVSPRQWAFWLAAQQVVVQDSKGEG